MTTAIRGSLLSFIYYWRKPVTGCLGRSRQNGLYIVVIGPQEWSSLSPESYIHWFPDENSGLITDLHTIGIIQIPIVTQHPEIPCLHPAVSSPGACPTPAR